MSLDLGLNSVTGVMLIELRECAMPLIGPECIWTHCLRLTSLALRPLMPLQNFRKLPLANIPNQR